jgi:hypothetical protein
VLDLRLFLNGQEMQESNRKNMIFGVAKLVAFISESITLEPGDLVVTGHRRWIQPQAAGLSQRRGRMCSRGFRPWDLAQQCEGNPVIECAGIEGTCDDEN